MKRAQPISGESFRWKRTIWCCIIPLLSACNFQSIDADMVIHNATILTMDPSGTIAQAMAVKDGKIVEVGANRQILNKYASPQRVDAMGGVLVPGLMDCHAHFVGYADGLLEADLVGTDSWDEVLDQLILHVQQRPSEWIIGRGWDQNDWELAEFPTRQQLDSLFPNQPVVLQRIDGHAVIANRQALEIAGITGESQFEGGEVVCDSNGEPTGVLIDVASEAMFAAIPIHDAQMRLDAILEAQRNLFERGITSVGDAGLDPSEIRRLEMLQDSGLLKLRISAMVSATDSNLQWLLDHGPIKKERLNVRSMKFYMDGSLGSRGAVLLDPYSDRPEWHGFKIQDLNWFKGALAALESKGLQAATHCIGDSAVRTVLKCYGEVLEGTNDSRWRIEHAQVVAKADFPLFRKYTIIPSVQPTHATSDMYWAGERLGRNRIRRAYAYKALLEQLGMMALGTDFPVEDIDPRKTFYAAVARKDASGFPKDGYQPENAISKEAALKGMTQWGALAQFQEAELGTLEVGKWADMTWMDRNWLNVDIEDVLETKIKGTCIAGEWVYLKSREQ